MAMLILHLTVLNAALAQMNVADLMQTVYGIQQIPVKPGFVNQVSHILIGKMSYDSIFNLCTKY